MVGMTTGATEAGNPPARIETLEAVLKKGKRGGKRRTGKGSPSCTNT
jgi:hypothetical protein